VSKGPSRRWFVVAVPLLSAVLTLAVVELGLAVLFPVPFPIEKNMTFQADPYTGYRLKPSSTGAFHNGIPARTNANGHRDRFVPQARQSGVPRVLVLGDSFTVGAGVAQEAAYPEVLEQLLSAAEDGPVEVINAGVGGWGPFHYAQYYEHYGRAFSPDLIMIGFFIGNDSFSELNDLGNARTAILGRRVSGDGASNPLTALKVLAVDHSHLARLMLNRGPVGRDFRRRHCADFTGDYLGIQRTRLFNHRKASPDTRQRARTSIEQIARIARSGAADGIPVAVVLIPDENQLNEALQRELLSGAERAEYDFAMPQRMLTELFAKEGIPVIDLLPAFEQDPRCLYMNDTHWTEEGHALAGSVIYRSLLDSGIWEKIVADAES
jgi:hypothetical protein